MNKAANWDWYTMSKVKVAIHLKTSLNGMVFFKKNILNYKVLLYTYLYIYIFLIYSKDYYAFLEDDEAKGPLTAAQIRGN